MKPQNLTLANSDDFPDASKNILSELALKEKNLMFMMQGISSPELNRAWAELKAYLPQIDRVVTGLFSDSKNNRSLTTKLHETGDSMLKTASKISEAVDSSQ